MKLKDFFYLLGFKAKPKSYGYKVHTFNLPSVGQVNYAQWLHPYETEKTFSEDALNELRTFLSPGDVAIDIGAHTGDTTLPIALAVEKSGCVLALEPNSYVFPVCQKNAQLNSDKTTIIPLMFAATPTNGEFAFEYSDAGFCNGGRHEGISRWKHGHAYTLKVTGKNLVEFLRKEYESLIPRIRYIKVDAEGYDYQILQSLHALLKIYKPYIKAEVFKRTTEEQRLQFYRFLSGLGYHIYRVESDARLKGKLLTEHHLMDQAHYDIFCTP